MFARAVEIVLREEVGPEPDGGYNHKPTDPGGETKWGIAKRFHPDLDIKALTKDAALALYDVEYWRPVKGEQLPWPLSLCVFDAAVNQGVDAAKKLLQKALDLPQDGLLGPATLKKANTVFLPGLVSRYMALRALRYTGTRGFDVNGRDWMIRLFNVTREAYRAVAAGS
jgi:lysozyme family protein